MGRALRKGVLFTLLFAGFVVPAAADPMVMFLLGVAREIVESHAHRPPGPPPDTLPLPDMSKVYPGTSVEPEYLRRLIDDCFMYLSSSQRREIFDTLHAALIDPKNAAVRGPMIEYFATKALAVRAAQLKLAEMPWRDKEKLAEEFRQELPGLSEEDRQNLGKLLRDGLLPVPSDLNQLLLAAFEAPR